MTTQKIKRLKKKKNADSKQNETEDVTIQETTIETTKSDETESIEEQQNTEIVQSKSENIEIETEISNLQELMNEGNQQ